MPDEPRKRIVVDPNFLKLPMRGGNRTRKNAPKEAKPIKIRADKPAHSEKTLKRRAIQYIRKQQEERYKRLTKGLEEDGEAEHKVEITGGKTYADEFKSGFDDSLAFLQKLTDQNSQKIRNTNSTLKQYPVTPNSTLFQSPVLDKVLGGNIDLGEMPDVSPAISNPKIIGGTPTYGCLKGGKLPTYRTLKSYAATPSTGLGESTSSFNAGARGLATNSISDSPMRLSSDSLRLPEGPLRLPEGPLRLSSDSLRLTEGPLRLTEGPLRLTPEQQRAELKQFLEKRKEEKQRIERVKRQRHLVNPGKKQKRTTLRTFRVGKSKVYPRVGVLIPNKTIRTQVLEKKQKIRETPIEDVRKYLIKKGLIRVGSSCPNDVLRKMHESSMMMCGEIQNHNPDNLLYNYLHNGL
jgi:hypothetical protein